MSRNCRPMPRSWWRMTRARSLPRWTSEPIAGRASVPIEAPESETSSTRHCTARPSASFKVENLLGTAVRSWRRSAAPGEFVAVDEPHDLSGELLALVLAHGQAQREAALEAAHHVAFDPADVVEIGNDALPSSTATGDIMATPPTEMSTSRQGYSCRLGRMKRPSSVTACRLWRRRSGAMRAVGPAGRRRLDAGVSDMGPSCTHVARRCEPNAGVGGRDGARRSRLSVPIWGPALNETLSGVPFSSCGAPKAAGASPGAGSPPAPDTLSPPS